MIVMPVQPDIAPLMVLAVCFADAADHVDLRAGLHHQIGIGDGDLLTDAFLPGEHTVAGEVIRLTLLIVFICVPVIGVVRVKVVVQPQRIFEIGVLRLHGLVEDLLHHFGKVRDLRHQLLMRRAIVIHEAGNAVFHGMIRIDGPDMSVQRRQALVRELTDHPFEGVVVRAGNLGFPGEHRVDQIVPRHDHLLAEHLGEIL